MWRNSPAFFLPWGGLLFSHGPAWRLRILKVLHSWPLRGLHGESIRFWGVSIAGSETRTTGNVGGTYLITNGPFAYVRNPLYVGNMVMYVGIGIMSMAVFPWLLLAAMVWFYMQYSLIVTTEEEYLTERFGAAYAEYRKNVRRFLPRLAPYHSPRPPDKNADFREGLASERRTLQAIGLVMLLLAIVFFIRGNG